VTEKELFLILTNSSKVSFADAVVLLEGDGYSRIPKAVSLIKEGWAKSLVFSGGIDNESAGSFTFEKCKDKFLDAGYDINKIILESNSQNTRQQALEIIGLCLKNNWKKIILVASHYHQYRAFLTFLKVLEEKDLFERIQIINSPAILNWFEESDSGKKRLDLLNDEFIKIDKYRLNYHVSSYVSALNYYKYWENHY
jgi:uncharacterized SAM-binding protein YcdF (DUF218 family)